MRIDMFGHGLASELRDKVLERFPDANPALANWVGLEPLFDHGRRVELLDRNGIDVQVLTTPSPPLEELFEGQELRDVDDRLPTTPWRSWPQAREDAFGARSASPFVTRSSP